MISIDEAANSLRFGFFDNTTNNPTTLVVQVSAEISDAEAYDIMDRLQDSDFVQRVTGVTAVPDGGGVLVVRSAPAVAP